jgi:hypothetical protein
VILPSVQTRSYNDNESYSSPSDRRKVGRQDENPDDDTRDDGPGEFSVREGRSIRSCLAGGQSGLPPGLAKRDRLPPGLERQVQRNGTLLSRNR